MPTTSKGFPYPSPNQVPDVPADIQALAVKIGERLSDYKVWVGYVTINVSAAIQGTSQNVPIPASVGFTSSPRVSAQVVGTAGYYATVTSAVTATQIGGVNVRSASNISGTDNVLVHLIAIGP